MQCMLVILFSACWQYWYERFRYYTFLNLCYCCSRAFSAMFGRARCNGTIKAGIVDSYI